ncbi:MAG TPA: hypothetical protein VFA26_25045 [Gemmataceae bacterium]|nr:hypothetical protein [Gemmataceae bacterium]
MIRWHRVFGLRETAPEPAALLEECRRLGAPAEGRFRGDDLGWFQADLVFDPDSPPVRVDRYLPKEEGIRGEMNTWAAWLETVEGNPHSVALMERVILTRQFFTLHQPVEDGEEVEADPRAAGLCAGLCRWLARETDGVYQADHAGFFDAGGALLVPED